MFNFRYHTVLLNAAISPSYDLFWIQSNLTDAEVLYNDSSADLIVVNTISDVYVIKQELHLL